MASDIFLVASPAITADRLQAQVARTGAAALLLRIGEGEDDLAYAARAKALAKAIQAHDCAVLLDNRPDLVRRTYVDGVHMSGGIKALREAIAELKPDFIVGTGDIGSRHEAMLRGELEVDYLMFGDRDDGEGRDMAQWWAETFEIPSVYCAAPGEDGGELGTEFIAYEEADWETIAGETTP